MKEKLYTLLFFLLVTISGKSQDFNPGPEAQNLTERKNVTVDYATGLFHYTVPLYQLKSGDYELPISLDYIAKGVKVSDPEGLIGQNWALNIGGVVTRTMRGGFVDEAPGLGYLWTENIVTPLEQDARSVGLRKRDGESDIFTAVFNGKKVDFIIRMNENKQICALPLGQTDVRIDCEGTSAEITGWTITDNNGDRYIYRQRERCMDVEYVDVSTSNAISDSGYTSAWHLTRILPYNGASIDFHYNGDVMNLSTSNSVSDNINTMRIYDSYKMTYHYDRHMKEQPFDFDQYRSDFNSAIESARHYLDMCSLGMHFKVTSSLISNYVQISQINTQPLLGEYVKTNNRIVGMLSNISKMTSASNELEENLRGLAKYCRSINDFNADMAGMYLDAAADYINACLSEVRTVKTKEIWGGSSYKILSPLPSMIVFPEYIVKFTYLSSSCLSAISLYNRNMEQLSSVSFIGRLNEVAFFDKSGMKTSNMKFSYYDKSDYPAWKEAGKDLWGYPLAKSEEGEYDECAMYAVLKSLKSIVLSNGGKIEIGYENNNARNVLVGGIRLRSLIFSDNLNERSDTIFYGYPQTGVSVYKSFSNVVRVSYPECMDKIEYGRIQLEGHPIVNVGNNGFYYPCVTETVLGKGTTTYRYRVTSPSSTTEFDYPYWLNGLLTEKSMYDSNGKMLKKIQYIYEVDTSCENQLPQMQPSNFYLDGETLKHFYSAQRTPYLTGEEFYQWNIEPRLSPTNTDRFYNLHYGWKTTLKEEVEYRDDKDIPYCRTRYCYDNPASVHPTRIIRTGTDGIERTKVLKRVMDMVDNVDSVFVKMKEVNLLLPVVKSLTLIDGKLINETVFRYQDDKESKVGFIAPAEVLTYIPDEPENYILTTVDTQLFTYGENNYITEFSYQYANQKVSRKCVETNGRTERKSSIYDNYGKLLLECDAMVTTASDKYKSMIENQSVEKIKSALRALKSRQENLPLLIEELKEAMDDEQSLQFLNSWNKCLITKFVEEILRGDPDLNQARFYYECIVCDDYEVLNWFKQECERILEFFPKCTPLKQYLSIVETLIHFNEQELFDYLCLQQYEVEKPSYWFDYSLKLIPGSDIRNLRLYILDGRETVSGSITHAGSDTPYTIESISSSKLKIYDIDLSKYTSITSVTVNNQGSYMALVPEGANFKATSYNPDGTVYARFDQSGNAEYYTYDAAGRVVKVEDQYGNILKTYEYNKLNN